MAVRIEYIFIQPLHNTKNVTRSILKIDLVTFLHSVSNAGLIFSFPSKQTKAKELILPYYLPIARGGRTERFICFPRVLA